MEYWFTAHLRLNGIYWGTTALALLNSLHLIDKNDVVENVMKCYHSTGIGKGGFGGNPTHDAHILNTLSAIQILATFDALDVIDADQVIQCIFLLK